MSQQIEVICRRCERRDILDHEIPEDYRCTICNLPAKPEEFGDAKLTKQKPIQIKIFDWWRCTKHNQTWGKNKTCLDCNDEETRPLITQLNPPNMQYEKILGEIDISKTESGARKRVQDHLIALDQARLNTPILLKEFITQQNKRDTEILKQLRQLNQNLEEKNDSS